MNDDLTGIDFTNLSLGIDFTSLSFDATADETGAVLRRMTSAPRRTSGNVRSNYRVGMIEDDRDSSEHAIKHSASVQESTRGGNETETKPAVGIAREPSGNEGQSVNGYKQSVRRRSAAPDVPPRNVTALLRNKKKLNDQTSPAAAAAADTLPRQLLVDPQSSLADGHLDVTKGEQSMAAYQMSMTDVDWRSEVERLRARLAIVEKERDEALAKVFELEQRLVINETVGVQTGLMQGD